MDKNKRNKSVENTTDARIENPDIEINDIETPETENRKRKERIPLSYGGIRQLPQTHPP